MLATSVPHELTELAALVLLLGAKHGLEADHLATIDALTRAATAAHPRAARACGMLFSLGHGAVVVAVALVVSQAAVAWRAPAWLGAFGAWVSIGLLITLGLMNIVGVLRTPAGGVVVPTGVRQRLVGRMSGRVPGATHPLWALPVGALFALSFDTVSQAAMLSTAATGIGAWQEALFCALLFTIGMLLADGINGLWISRLLRRGDVTAHIASRTMGLGVGVASLLMAGVGIARESSRTATAWLAGREMLPSLAVVGIVLVCAFVPRAVARLPRGAEPTPTRSSGAAPTHR